MEEERKGGRPLLCDSWTSRLDVISLRRFGIYGLHVPGAVIEMDRWGEAWKTASASHKARKCPCRTNTDRGAQRCLSAHD